MSNKKITKNLSAKLYRSLLLTALVANSVFQLVAPALAEGTAAGQQINNSATATYEDPNDPDKKINATSNTVKVTVAEVAGITVTGMGTEFQTGGDTNGDGDINARDLFYFIYDVTNIGNDATKFQIPGTPVVNGPAALDGAVQISYDGTTWQDVPAAGLETNSMAPGGVVKVRVPVKVDNDAATGADISVQLGDTTNNDQNVPFASGGQNRDVRTVDNLTQGNGEVDRTPPSNGEREASATQIIQVDSNLKNYTLATVFKRLTDSQIAGATGPQDDTVSYELSLKVEDTDLTGNGITPTPLEGIEVPGISAGANDKRILVADAIPENTVLESFTAPSGWLAVFTDVPATTQDANQATWQPLTTTTDLTTVRRIGFVRTGSINPGQTVNGFLLTVKVTSTASTVTIANVAQLFGQTPNGAPVYDESGDATPSNYNPTTQLFPGTTQPGNIPTTIPDSEIDDGFIDPTDSDNNNIPDELDTYGIDTNNNNTGTGSGGEANVITINQLPATSVLNGPLNQPNANVDGDTNKDFTNQSTPIAAGTQPGTQIDPAEVTFENTVKNTGNSNADIRLFLQAPDTPGDLPANTEVTITYTDGTSTQEAVYIYDGNTFNFDSGTGNAGANPVSGTNPIRITALPANGTTNYTVKVDLPGGTDLSTDIERGYPVPIRAFVDNDEDAVADIVNGNPAENITIDRVYTGYLKLVKESRILQGDGPAVGTGQDDFATTPGIGVATDDVERTPAPGNIIEYRIRYKNISEIQNGPGNVILNASNIEIIENGTIGGNGGNNWALDNDGDSEIDTSNVVGSAQAANANITYSPGGDQSGITAAQDVTEYKVNSTTDVAPQEEREFIFQRKVNGTSPTGTPNN